MSISVHRKSPLAYRDLLWPDEHEGPYYVRITLDEVQGRVELSGVSFFGHLPGLEPPWSGRTTEDSVPVSPRVLHSLPLGRLSTTLLSELRERWVPLIEAQCRSEGAQRSAQALRQPSPQRGRPALYSEAHFAAVATLYSTTKYKPVMAVAEAFSVSRWTAVGWVRKARALGLL